MYIYIFIYIHVNIYTYMYIYICVYIHTYTYIHIYIYVYTHIYIYIYTHINIYIYISICWTRPASLDRHHVYRIVTSSINELSRTLLTKCHELYQCWYLDNSITHHARQMCNELHHPIHELYDPNVTNSICPWYLDDSIDDSIRHYFHRLITNSIT